MKMKHEYGDGPIERRYSEQMKAIIMTVDEFVNGDKRGEDREIGIILMMFPFGDDPSGRVNYMSNGVSREDVITLMKQQITRFEGMPDVSGTA